MSTVGDRAALTSIVAAQIMSGVIASGEAPPRDFSEILTLADDVVAAAMRQHPVEDQPAS